MHLSHLKRPGRSSIFRDQDVRYACCTPFQYEYPTRLGPSRGTQDSLSYIGVVGVSREFIVLWSNVVRAEKRGLTFARCEIPVYERHCDRIAFDILRHCWRNRTAQPGSARDRKQPGLLASRPGGASQARRTLDDLHGRGTIRPTSSSVSRLATVCWQVKEALLHGQI